MSLEEAGQFEARARRETARVIRRIIDFAVALVFAIWALSIWSMWTEYSITRSSARAQSIELTNALGLELGRSLTTADNAFKMVDTALQAGASGLSVGLGDDGLLASVRRISPAVRQVAIIEANGQSAYPPGSAPLANSHDAGFAAHRDNPSAGVIVEPPVRDPPGIEVSQRLATPNGDFAGEVLLRLDPALLMPLAAEIDTSPGRGIVIAGLDGVVRAGFDRQHLDGAFSVGVDLSMPPFPAGLRPGEVATYSRPGLLVNSQRQVTIRRLARYPLLVLVGIDEDEMLRPARARAWFIAAAAAAVTLLIALLTWLLAREVWRRIGREIELAHDRDRLRNAQAQIEADRARMEETGRELMASRDRAEAANRARSQFLAHMSHEFRTPLHSIIGFSELIRDQAPANPKDPPIASYAEDILSSGRHLLELINTVLDISKVESGTAVLTETVFVVSELMRNAVIVIAAQAEARCIRVDMRPPLGVFRLNADRTRLLQVLLNLLSNAVKFTPPNGSITFEAAQLENGDFEFTVTDTGIGMTEAELHVAMEPFGQVDNSLTRSFEGTGLGLPLAARLTELHGRRLELHSVKGKGTVARVILPASRVVTRQPAAV